MVIMTNSGCILLVQFLGLFLAFAQSSAQILDSSGVFTVTGCPLGPIIRELPQAVGNFLVVNWEIPTATSSAGITDTNPEQVSGQPNGTNIEVNMDNKAVYKWTDMADNEAFCTITVRVQRPNIFSVVVCPPLDLNVNTETSVATWTFPIPSSSEGNVNIDRFSHNSGHIFPPGDTTVSYTWKDDAGNYAQCEFTVTVNSVMKFMSRKILQSADTSDPPTTTMADTSDPPTTTMDKNTAPPVVPNTTTAVTEMMSVTSVDPCVDMPCENGGTCYPDDMGGYTCACADGFEGENCQNDTNECLDPSVCDTNAYCNNTFGSYNCTCKDGYRGNGTSCTDINECEPGPCENNGVCKNLENRYECDCTGTGYNGTNCTIDIDECELMMDNCSPDASCNNTDGSYVCTCNLGFEGDGVTCTKCTPDKYGLQCNGTCTCVEGADCNHVNGSCTCDPVFENQECDKADLEVDVIVSETPEKILDGTNITLTCRVNLPSDEIDNSVTWTLPDDTTRTVTFDGVEDGEYDLHLTNLQPETDSGEYTCTATTLLQNGVVLEMMAVITVDVKAPGRIITAPGEASAELNGEVQFNCTVYGNTEPVITWYGTDEQLLEDTPNKIEITEPPATDLYKTSILTILNIVREDNGTYLCNATNTLTKNEYGIEGDVGEYHLLVLEPPEIDITTVMAQDESTIQVKWEVTFTGNMDLDVCTVEYREGDEMGNPIDDWVIATDQAPGKALIYDIPGLMPYTYYLVRLTCNNGIGDSNMVTGGPERTRQFNPSKPLNVQSSNIQQTTVRLQWEEPEQKNGPIAFYRIMLSSSEGDEQKDTSTNSIFEDVRGLLPGIEYSVTISAVNRPDDGVELVGDQSDVLTFSTRPDVPSPPTGVKADDKSETCTITWEPPETPRGEVTAYTIYFVVQGRGEDPGDPVEGEPVPITDPSMSMMTFQESDQIAYSKYDYTVTASTSAGEGEESSPVVSCMTEPGPPVEPPEAPQGPSNGDPQAVTTSTFKMTLSPASNRNGPVGCYEVVVIPIEKGKENDFNDKGNPDELYPPQEVKDYEETEGKPGQAYTAMVISGSNLTDNKEITVGQGGESFCNDNNDASSRRKRETVPSEERSAENGRLRSGVTYSAFTRAYVPIGDGTQSGFTSSAFMDPIKLPVDGGLPGPVVAVIVIIVLLLVAALILGGLVLYKRRLQKSGEPLTTNGTDTPMALGIVNPGMADIVDVPPIPIEQLEGEYQRKMANNNAIFQAEFKSIPESTGDVTKEVSLSELAKDKNRYINIIAYDQTRVRLQEIEDEPGSDYINACYVDGYHHPAKFIASQGPRDDTIDDFWRMVWEQNSTTIVMLTKCFEHGKDKCAQYWPDSGSETHGNLTITMEDSVVCSDYVIRKFSIAEKGDEEGAHARSVTQFHYLAWPDFGIPDYPYSMMAFLKRVRQMTYAKADKGNIVVHCSAGVGRTGTYILIDTMIEMIAKEKQVDIYNFIYKIRSQRNLLVQSIVQYIFIHRALVEEYKFGHTEVDLMNLTGYYLKLTKPDPETQKSGVDLEYKMVASQIVAHTEQEFGNKEANKEKNRLRQVVPFDRNRIKLERLIGEEHSDYINASFIDGYEHKRAYIATQGPLSNTVSDFWRMVWEEQCATIVMLTKLTEKGQEVCHQYWPGEDDSATQSYLAIQHVSEEDQGEYIVRDFQLTNTKGGGLRKIRQYHFQDWPEVGMPESGVSLIKLIGEAHKHQKSINHYPIIVHGSSGAGRTGVFCALSILLGRIQAEGVVDVFQTVRTLRQQRPHMVQDPTQYQFCYKAILNHLDSYGTYANYR